MRNNIKWYLNYSILFSRSGLLDVHYWWHWIRTIYNEFQTSWQFEYVIKLSKSSNGARNGIDKHFVTVFVVYNMWYIRVIDIQLCCIPKKRGSEKARALTDKQNLNLILFKLIMLGFQTVEKARPYSLDNTPYIHFVCSVI